MNTDFLIVGSGIAGLTFAVKTAERFPKATITVLTKARDENETNTKYAQGGIAVVNKADDSYEKHIQDTLIAGDGLCDLDVVEVVVKEGTAAVQEMIDWGTNFDKTETGEYSRGKEGGHSEFRILHFKDITGWEIERALLEKAAQFENIKLLNEYFVLDIITQHHLGRLVTKSTPDVQCYGVYALNLETNKIETLCSKVTLLATGGAGQVYRSTTNPVIATGDGIAMVYRAKGRIENMEFIQFHPTALYEVGVSPSFLITEAVRGDGGILCDANGVPFMGKYDERKDLAPRDIVARAIDNEMKIAGTPNVYLDCRHMDKDKFLHHFPNIYEKCKSIGIDVFTQLLPVTPAAHYTCGGIKVNLDGETSIKRLFACGECSSTGLHGANRLASNSLLEAAVFGNRSAAKAAEIFEGLNFQGSIPAWNTEGTTEPREKILITQSRKELENTMSDYVGIVRNDVRLERAMRRLDLLHDETEQLYNESSVSPQLCELRNLITVGYLIVKSASFRKESRGLHFTTDYPNKSEILQDIIL